MTLSRRQVLAVLGLAGCERTSESIGSFLLSDHEPVEDELTPEDAIPGYHIAPALPTEPPDWNLKVTGERVATPLRLSLTDIRAMPSITVRIRHHSVRGWTAVADWTGVRLSELAKQAGAKPTRYVEFRSFDVADEVSRGYWSSWDHASAMHPHTMIAYAMNGRPLTAKHGAPVRVYGSVKLGYKNVKYLTEVNFLNRRTGGYWEQRGHEWFAGV